MIEKSADWLDHEDTKLLRRKMEGELANAVTRLRAAAGSSPDPKCAELARECRKIEEFMKELVGEKNASKRDG